MSRSNQLTLKDDWEIAVMRDAGRIVARVLERMGEMVAPGVSTLELDREAEAIIRDSGAIPTFKGYEIRGGIPAYPGTICASVNGPSAEPASISASVRQRPALPNIWILY